jgi:hypothetical protein
MLNSSAYADLLRLLGSESFGDSLRYGAFMYQIDDLDASELLSKNGILLSGEGESSVRLHKEPDVLTLGGWMQGQSWIEHDPSGNSSAGEGLVIRFKYPVRKFGISLGQLLSLSDQGNENGGAASLRAYTKGGQLVGTADLAEENVGYQEFQLPESVFGFETTTTSGVATVVMDFGDSEVCERIVTLFYEYTVPRPFRIILPQIAQGTASGASINSDFWLFSDHAAFVRVFSPEGDILPFPIFSEGSEFLLDTGNQRYFKSSTIPGIDDLTVGYVVGESDYPIDGQVVYRTTDAQGKVYEADIRGCVPETYLQIPFELNQAENLNAALAIVNPSDTEAQIEIHVNDEEQSYTEFWNPPTFTLQPGEQRALFMWELWNEMPSEDGQYILQLRSAVPFAATGFYTRNWIVVGNLPVWSYQEGQAR